MGLTYDLEYWYMCWKCHKVQEKYFKNRFWPVHPLGTLPTKRSKKLCPLLTVFQDFFQNGTQNMVSFFCIELSGSSRLIKAFKHLIEHEQFWKKSVKISKRVQFFGTFLSVESHFLKNGPSKSVLIFALQSVHQDASFELSNSTIRWFSISTLVRGILLI